MFIEFIDFCFEGKHWEPGLDVSSQLLLLQGVSQWISFQSLQDSDKELLDKASMTLMVGEDLLCGKCVFFKNHTGVWEFGSFLFQEAIASRYPFLSKKCCFSTAAKLNGAISPLVLSTPRVVQMHSFGTKQQNFESQLHSNQANSWVQVMVRWNDLNDHFP